METAKTIILDHEPKPVEVEVLFLPSEFSVEQREKLGLGKLAELEAELWEGQASECILRLRCIMKLISGFQGERQKNPGTQREGTRSRSKIQILEFLKDRVLSTYSDSRSALGSLGKLDTVADRYPHLTERDLERKSTRDKRSLGDSYRPDGGLWGLGGKTGSGELVLNLTNFDSNHVAISIQRGAQLVNHHSLPLLGMGSYGVQLPVSQIRSSRNGKRRVSAQKVLIRA
jgi:hypothetical protein